jgi:hypothetical protein
MVWLMSSNGWYVAVDETTRGPAPTELVVKGIEHRKVPPEALVCEVGAARWVPLATVPDFHAAVVRSYPPPPPDTAEARLWLEQGFHFPPPAPLPRFDGGAAMDSRVSIHSIPEIDVEMDPEQDEPSPVDWTDPFASFFLVGEDVVLPDERALLGSLAVAPRETFRREESLWNLALCLAYGSDELGTAAARAFFEAVGEQGDAERIEWMRRTLEGTGFVPSGLPEEAGRRAFERLRSTCPPALSDQLS